MKIAIPASGDNVAPTFDFVDEFVVIENVKGNTISKQRYILNENFALLRVKILKGMNINTVICGGISNPVVNMFKYYGITVISSVTGSIDNVTDEYLSNISDHTKSSLPGFTGKGRCRQKGGGHKKSRRSHSNKEIIK